MSGNSNSKKLMSDINLTPIVDVTLVLLIIYMVTAPMMIQGVDVDLPETTASELKTSDDPFILTIDRNGEVSVERHVIELNELEDRLTSIFRYRRDKEVLLRADKDVPYGFVIKVMAAVKRAGIEKLGMITEPEE